jgi:hypothetical protein
VKSLLKQLLGRVLCLMGDHSWTCAAEEGIKTDDIPSVKKLLDNGQHYAGFILYAKMYCRRCHHIYRGSM